MDLNLSSVPSEQLEMIANILMTVDRSEVNMFYPYFIYNVITSNDDEISKLLLENLPIYIISWLAYPEKEYISEYEELKFKMQKYYLWEIVVKLMIHFHRKDYSTHDNCYYYSKKAVKALLQNIFEDLNCYEISFWCSLSDTISETLKSEKSYEEEKEHSTKKLNDEIFCLLITLMHNCNEHCHGIVGVQKLELIKSPSKEEAKSDTEQPLCKQLIDRYFKIQSERHDFSYDEKTRKDVARINASVMKLVQ